MSEPIWTPEQIQQKLADFLKPLLAAARIQVDFEVLPGDDANDLISPDYLVNFHGKDVELLLEQRGELLLALEQLTLEVLRISHDDRFRLVFDADEYRMLRIEELRLSAEAAAAQVKKNGRPYKFGAMTSRERRILHLALQNDQEVETTSEGVAPNRYTVIYPAKTRR